MRKGEGELEASAIILYPSSFPFRPPKKFTTYLWLLIDMARTNAINYRIWAVS